MSTLSYRSTCAVSDASHRPNFFFSVAKDGSQKKKNNGIASLQSGKSHWNWGTEEGKGGE